MDRFDVINFADLTGPDGGEWVKIGGGSFGVVFKGEYLGTQVAIKEVLPNNTYDVEKYFERECVLMKEARHPNITQYIGLTKSPGPDGRIYIISEFVGGNLRGYIADKKKPFPWRLRMSFAMDIARALAYLHARNCMHRDLKGENLLITANERIKVCDFGFARIAARNDDEMRRISYCGTDGYMSPEILLGLDFGLPSDVFSLGVIFAEIASRHLVDSQTFKRTVPTFGLDADEVREMACEGCPEAFIQLILDCVEEDARDRPDMRQVVVRLRTIEREVLLRDEKENRYAIGSVRGATVHSIMGTKLKRMTAPRLPSFNGAVKLGSHSRHTSEDDEASGSSGDELEEALVALEKIGIDPDDPKKQGSLKATSTFKVSGHGNPWWSEDNGDSLPSINQSWLPSPPTSASARRGESQDGLLANQDYADSDYSTSVIRSSKLTQKHAPLPIMEEPASSTMTVTQDSSSSSGGGGGGRDNNHRNGHAGHAHSHSNASSTDSSPRRQGGAHSVDPSFMTAHTHRADPSLALATLASAPSDFYAAPGPIHHRFTLVKNSTKRPASIAVTAAAAATGGGGNNLLSSPGSLLPPAVMLSNALAKCWVCGKRIGWKPFMDCDDCPYKTHVGCADLAPPTCQDMLIPPGPSGNSAQPVLTPQNASRRNSRALDVADPKAVSAAAAALKAAATQPDADPAKGSGSPGGGAGGLLKGKGMKKMFGANGGAATPPRRGSLAA